MSDQVPVRYVGPTARPITIAATDARVCKDGSPFAVVERDAVGQPTKVLADTADVPRALGERLVLQDAWEPVGWEPEGATVPENVDDVKAWVGDDPIRAEQAIAVERHRTGGPRKTLLPHLQEVAAATTASTPDDPADDGQEG